MRRTLAISVRILVVLAVLWAVGAVRRAPGPRPTAAYPSGTADHSPDAAGRAYEALCAAWRTGLRLAAEHPGPAAVAGSLAGVWLLVVLARARAAAAAPRDPRRTFTAEERRAGFARAGGRCEFDAWMGLSRCRRRAEHADHWWPHSRGGATTLANLVAGCAWHNVTKGAALPTAAQTRRITRRRRGYFPSGGTTRPGERYRVR